MPGIKGAHSHRAPRRSSRTVGDFVAALVLAIVSVFLLPAAWSADSSPALVLVRTITLAHVGGRIDHMAVDLRRHRLFIAELGNDTVDVIDLATGTLLHRFGGLKAPQGIAYVPGLDAVVAASADDGSVYFYRGGDFAALGAVNLGSDADNVRFDTGTGHVVVGHGERGLAVIDPATRSVLQDIKLPGHPESFQIDPQTNRALVNIPDAGQIAVVDLVSGRLVAKWTVPDLSDNFPMAFDGPGATIATVYRSPPRLVLLDSATGSVTGTIATCADADDVFFDARRHRIYVSCGAGALDVFARDATETRHLDRILTSSGARTSLYVPELDKFYVAARAGLLGSDAAILVFRPNP